jgi:hypothetical protein
MRAKHHGLAILRLDKPGLSHGPHRFTVSSELLRVVIQMGQLTQQPGDRACLIAIRHDLVSLDLD